MFANKVVGDPYSLRPLCVSDCSALTEACLAFYEAREDERWRRYEWPFADQKAASLHGISLAATSLADDRTPGAWTLIGADDAQPVGLIAATLHDPVERCALLGTYITPTMRGQGLQLLAKALLFDQLSSQVDQYLCLIEKDNMASLRGIEKCTAIASVTELSTQKLPAAFRSEWVRLGQPARVFRLTPRLALH